MRPASHYFLSDSSTVLTNLTAKLTLLLFKFHTPSRCRSNMGRGILLTANLPQLQNLIKRDPLAYQEEFLQQWNHYNSVREIFQTNPDEQAHHFRDLVTFISQVSPPCPILSFPLEETFFRSPNATPNTRRNFRRKYLRCSCRIMVHYHQRLGRPSCKI